MRAEHLVTYPRNLHPGAWWLWAVALAAAASRTANPVPLLLILVVTAFVVAARRSSAPWASSYVAFLKLSLVVVVVRILLQALLSTGAQGPTVLFTLPALPMPANSGLKLGGVVSLEAVLQALYEGLQLATILCCVGAANALGSARRLLRYVPGALYEIGVACVIALTFAPQLVTDAARVRAAHRLRGRNGGLGSLRRLAMPVLEGALERSVDLAAAMDARGYGRTTDADRVSRRVTALLVFGGLLGVCIGVYGLLDGTASTWMGAPMLAGGVVLGAVGLHVGGRRTGRTR
jgi:energy-coupling factor transport system permease protein